MRTNDIPQIAELSTSEKILLIEDLWDEISGEESDIPVPDSHKEELDVRLEQYNSNPGDLLSLDELQERINSLKKRHRTRRIW